MQHSGTMCTNINAYYKLALHKTSLMFRRTPLQSMVGRVDLCKYNKSHIHSGSFLCSSKQKDYYKLLGLARDATLKDIKDAYLQVNLFVALVVHSTEPVCMRTGVVVYCYIYKCTSVYGMLG